MFILTISKAHFAEGGAVDIDCLQEKKLILLLLHSGELIIHCIPAFGISRSTPNI